jgi:hypothetical protein
MAERCDYCREEKPDTELTEIGKACTACYQEVIEQLEEDGISTE